MLLKKVECRLLYDKSLLLTLPFSTTTTTTTTVPETKGLALEEIEKLFASDAASTMNKIRSSISLRSLFSCRRAAGATPLTTAASPYPLSRARSMSQQGSNGDIAGFIETLLPVEKSDPTASPYSSMLGVRPTAVSTAGSTATTTTSRSTLSSSGGAGDADGPEHDGGGSPTSKRQHNITLSV